MKFDLCCFLLIIFFTLPSCDMPSNSLLNNRDVTNPSDLSVEFRLSRSTTYVSENSYSERIQTQYECKLKDKNGDRVKIESGKVRINGRVMAQQLETLYNLPLYVLSPSSTLPWDSSAVYQLSVTLEDGETYYGEVQTPAPLYYDCPPKISRGTDLMIKFSGIDTLSTINVDVFFYSVNGERVTEFNQKINPVPGQLIYTLNTKTYSDPQIGYLSVSPHLFTTGRFDEVFRDFDIKAIVHLGSRRVDYRQN